uniref:Lipase n=1 Tax=Amblyomma triste TaxID=251400 RepID=A0A023GN79_AMBTT
MSPALVIATWLRALFFLTPLVIPSSSASDVYEDAILDPADLMRKFGYTVEVYNVTTDDGYILEVDRILPKTSTNGSTTKKTPILLVHGLFCNAATWVANQPSQSPGFLLADAGFDVWLINSRGVPQSNRHVNLSTNDPKFWAWSFDEIGRFDLPAVVDKMLNVTSSPNVSILATSRGTASSLVFLSLRPEYNKKVSILVNYAPVANVTHITSPIRRLIPVAEKLKTINDLFTHGGFMVQSPAKRRRTARLCDSLLRKGCYLPVSTLYGINWKQHNSTRIPVYLTNLLVGSSSQDVVHFAQMFRRKDFVRYDYGEDENKNRYNQTTPPAYPLEKISVPVALYQGCADYLADPLDVDDLYKRLPHVVHKYVVPDPNFGHLDFIFGYNATEILHKNMIELVSNYTREEVRM